MNQGDTTGSAGKPLATDPEHSSGTVIFTVPGRSEVLLHTTTALTLGVYVCVVFVGLGHLLDLPTLKMLRIFWHLIVRFDVTLALLGVVSVLVGYVAFKPRVDYRRLLRICADHPWRLGALVSLLSAAGSLYFHGARPLVMDEIAPYFQSQVFASGHLAAQMPPEVAARAIWPPFMGTFFVGSSSGSIVSAYWPGFALLLTPFTLAGLPWLLNPLLSGLCAPVFARLVDELQFTRESKGLGLILLLCSPVFLASAITFYSMPAHMLCNLTFAWLLVRRRKGDDLRAGLVGGFALALHNPVPHVLFALPWILSLVFSKGQRMRLVVLGAGYLIPFSLLVAAWAQLRLSPGSLDLGSSTFETLGAVTGQASRNLLDNALQLTRGLGFESRTLVHHGLGLAKLVVWAVPGLVFTAILACFKLREQGRGTQLLALSALTTVLGYFLVPFDQGHGWGYRYFHSAFAVLPILAASLSKVPGGPLTMTSRALASHVKWSVLSLMILVVALCQIREFIQDHRSQIPAVSSDEGRYAYFIRTDVGYYSQDLIANSPQLDDRVLYFHSRGYEQDALFIERFMPGAKQVDSNSVATLWRLSD